MKSSSGSSEVVFVSQWCCKSGPLKVICQFSHDLVGRNTHVKFVSSHWPVLVSLNPSIVSQIKLVCL